MIDDNPVTNAVAMLLFPRTYMNDRDRTYHANITDLKEDQGRHRKALVAAISTALHLAPSIVGNKGGLKDWRNYVRTALETVSAGAGWLATIAVPAIATLGISPLAGMGIGFFGARGIDLLLRKGRDKKALKNQPT